MTSIGNTCSLHVEVKTMEIQRKAYRELLNWKSSNSHSKAIIIKGARRVGKSYLAEKFAKNEYRSHIVIDFASPVPGTKKIFERYGNRYTIDEFFNQISVLYGVPLYDKDSVLIFDEVQIYPKAREFIKYLVADDRYDYIETGSLISVKKNSSGIIIPSEEEELTLSPLDFEEFLTAIGDEVTFAFLNEAFKSGKPLGNLLKTVNERLRLYMIVGGMPQAVVTYCESRNYNDVERIKRGIIKLYREDIAKYAEGYTAEATAVFNSIPAQLSHHDKKLKYSSLGEGKRSEYYSDAVYWMGDSMVANLCYLVEEPSVFDGFSVNVSKVKCYMGDTGLLLTLASGDNYLKSDLYKSFMLGKLSVNKGMMTENLVAQMLTANHRPLRFYEIYAADPQGKTKKYELDFLLNDGNRVTPIEVKSGQASVHSSIDYYIDHFHSGKKGIILTKGDYRETGKYIYCPLAMTMFL